MKKQVVGAMLGVAAIMGMNVVYGMGIFSVKAENVHSCTNSQMYSSETELRELSKSSLSSETSEISLASSYYVYTPRGTAVSVYLITSDYTNKEILNQDLQDSIAYPNAERLGSSTKHYNCHSYAWYLSSTNNTYWMNDPSAYYTDGSYYEVSTAAAGDIICYYNASGLNLHSGKIVAVSSTSSDLSSITVQSKWGECGLYRHAADYCPYMPAYGGTTSYVKYYRHAAHTYNQECVYVNELYHTANCLCGDSILVNHSVRASEISGNTAPCMGCGATLNLSNGNYPVSPTSMTNRTNGGSYLLPNSIAVISDEDMDLFLQGLLYINGKQII